MSRHDNSTAKAVALQYGQEDAAPVVVASGMGYLAEKIVETAQESGVPIYEDNSLATILTQLKLGEEIPEALYQAIVELYVYFLKFDPSDPDGSKRAAAAAAVLPAEQPQETGEIHQTEGEEG